MLADIPEQAEGLTALLDGLREAVGVSVNENADSVSVKNALPDLSVNTSEKGYTLTATFTSLKDLDEAVRRVASYPLSRTAKNVTVDGGALLAALEK